MKEREPRHKSELDVKWKTSEINPELKGKVPKISFSNKWPAYKNAISPILGSVLFCTQQLHFKVRSRNVNTAKRIEVMGFASPCNGKV